MTRKEIQAQFEKTIKKETGQDVEITLISENKLSMYGTINAVRMAHSGILALVDTLEFESQETYEEDDEECIFYTF